MRIESLHVPRVPEQHPTPHRHRSRTGSENTPWNTDTTSSSSPPAVQRGTVGTANPSLTVAPRGRTRERMRLEVIPWPASDAPAEATLRDRLAREGYDAFAWTDAPGAHYNAHSHDHDESIWLVSGAIVFGAEGREYPLGPGDRLMLPAGMVHTAHAGPDGATYLIGERR